MVAAITEYAEVIDGGDYSVPGQQSLEFSDISDIVDASRAQGISTELVDVVQRLIHRQIDAGHGERRRRPGHRKHQASGGGGMTSVTVLGLGPMGQALSGALLDANYRTTVWNRTESKADALRARGAAWAATPG